MIQKVALVAIGRLENQYAREWAEHHLAAGFQHIIIYDNNREGEEHFEEVLSDLIADGKVEIVNWRDRESAQREAYNDAYRTYGLRYDWLAFFDFDEFLCFSEGHTLQSMLSGIPRSLHAVMVPWLSGSIPPYWASV